VRKAFRELAEEDEPVTEKVYRQAETTAAPDQQSNRIVAAWLKRRQERAPETLVP
jgi:hypothetical protein